MVLQERDHDSTSPENDNRKGQGTPGWAARQACMQQKVGWRYRRGAHQLGCRRTCSIVCHCSSAMAGGCGGGPERPALPLISSPVQRVGRGCHLRWRELQLLAQALNHTAPTCKETCRAARPQYQQTPAGAERRQGWSNIQISRTALFWYTPSTTHCTTGPQLVSYWLCHHC